MLNEAYNSYLALLHQYVSNDNIVMQTHIKLNKTDYGRQRYLTEPIFSVFFGAMAITGICISYIFLYMTCFTCSDVHDFMAIPTFPLFTFSLPFFYMDHYYYYRHSIHCSLALWCGGSIFPEQKKTQCERICCIFINVVVQIATCNCLSTAWLTGKY